MASTDDTNSDDRLEPRIFSEIRDLLGNDPPKPAQSKPMYAASDEQISIRPTSLNEIIGQDHLKASLRQFMQASLARKRTLAHILLYGPPGIGKTAISRVIASEMQGLMVESTGPTFSKMYLELFAGRQMSRSTPRTFLFIDEIHKLHPDVMTILLPMLEDFTYDGADLRPFTLIGATTDPGDLDGPLRRRFGIQYHLTYYSIAELAAIITETYVKLAPIPTTASDLAADPVALEAITMIAERSIGIPAKANILTERVIDYLHDPATQQWLPLSPDRVLACCQQLGIDKYGLGDKEREMIHVMSKRFKLKATGLESIARAMGDDPKTVEAMIEPTLVRLGFVDRAKPGRMLTGKGVNLALAVELHRTGVGELPWQ